MQRLNFPAYDFDTGVDEQGAPVIFDTVRRKYVRLTPEEWVRQHLLRYLVEGRGFPSGLAAVETGFFYGGSPVRADLILHDRTGKPILMAECKAPDIKITQTVFEQLARYNTVVGARYLVATNGVTHFCCLRPPDTGGYVFLHELPIYSEV
ncbi:MAG: type I restriction enzyme HsdR N-terminal domain-containing protein [candidate division Zixibacteria bacterium]|nr:type I restriction enzyme HsdR N-terminal domain-containing protein [candidate division Zixibacteria bacterium]